LRDRCARPIRTGCSSQHTTAEAAGPRRLRWLAGIAILSAACLAACTAPPPPPTTPSTPKLTLAPVEIATLPGWTDDRIVEALPAFLRSCAAFAKMADDETIGGDGIAGTAAAWRGPCAAAEALQPERGAVAELAVRAFFQDQFRAYAVGNNGDRTGLFTGYYEAEAQGSRRKTRSYAAPLLKRPPDLVMVDLGRFRPAWRGERIAGRVVEGRLEPYDTRAEIEGGSLDRFRLAFLWVDDPVDLFFLQIQGSGRIHLTDGTMVRVQYDGQNGQPYVAIGKKLVARGALTLDEVSMASIRSWIVAHPEEGKALMAENSSYVFFRELKGDGPLGSEGVVLTPGRSLAVDRDYIPLGAPVWLDASQGGETVRRLAVAQDTGGAIRGPVRGDVFWGYGSEAEDKAGKMRAAGAYYLLLPRDVTVRSDDVSPAAATQK
jgi:membrane-bound lytic murein transglycosylase A